VRESVAGVEVVHEDDDTVGERVMVHHVLSGKVKGRRGEAHHIAVALGIKDGVPGGKPSDYAKLAKRSKSRKAK